MIKNLFILLVLINLNKASTFNNQRVAFGTIKSIQIDDKVTIHHYESPIPILVSSYIIELPTKLVIFDTQFILPAASEVLLHARSLNKTIDRVIISHSHPDHYFGLEVFKNVAPIFALDETIREIASSVYYAINRNKGSLDGLIPNVATFPNRIQNEGPEVIDGILFNFLKIQKTESPNTLVLVLPFQRSMFVGDIVFNNVHFYLAEKNFENWISVLKSFQRDFLFFNIFQGHGTPTTTLKLQDSINYLDYARQAYNSSKNFEAFKNLMVNRFPDYKLQMILDIAEDYLYP
jgi:glyoxylase-like metal-dependent hydrolase (beta-lactamase superfamily II)